MIKKCGVCKVGQWIVGIGALVWGLVGINPGLLAQEVSGVLRLLFIVVGISGLLYLFCLVKSCPKCVDSDK